MEEQNNWSSGFEFVDIEIIDHMKEVDSPQKWNCDQCSLFYLSYENLVEHKKKHMNNSEVKCRYCNKVLSTTEESRECYANGKCETCEYRCSQCPQRFLRHSSLMNHENNHSKTKKKKTTALTSVDKRLGVITPKQNNNKKNLHKKVLKVVDPEALSSSTVDSGDRNKRKRNSSLSSRKKARLQTDTTMTESNIIEGDTGASSSRELKRSSLKPSKSVKERDSLKLTKQTKEKSPVKFTKTTSEKTPNTKNKTTISKSDTPSTSGNEVNSVNYKPFSCHVCNDNFASENILLEHIQSHGDAANSFRCKFCSEEFETIYEIQYHLAVCPLAEDELECTLKNSTPPKFITKTPKSVNKTSSQRKRGRPRKLEESLPNSKEGTDTVTLDTAVAAPLVRTRNKRTSYAKSTEPSNKIAKVTSNPVPNGRQKLPMSVQETCSMKDNDEIALDNAQSDLLENDISGDISSDNLNDQSNESFETSVKNQKKHNICPFPRCGMKFTREKALECHMRNHNDDFDDVLKCHKCDIPFDDIKSLRIHVDECQGLREEKDDDFSGPKKIRPERQDVKTARTHKSDGDFLCKTCGRTYHTAEKLKRHMAGHSSSNFVCRICKDVFANQTLLDQHFSDLHPTKTSHHCVTCNEDFISELFLQIHDTEYHSTSHTTLTKQGSRSLIETKSPRKNKSINSKRFNNSGYLQKIVGNTLAYRDDNLFWCPICFESYSKRENLRDHFRSSHIFVSGSVYVCELCDIEKPSAEMLCWHLEVHSNNRLSVNRFSKLRTCFSSIKKEESIPETTFQTGKTESTIKTKTKLNNLKSFKRETNTDNSSNQETRLETYATEKHVKMGLCKEKTVQKLTSGRLKLYISRNQRGLHSQLKTQSLKRSKLNRLALKKSLLQVNNTNTPRMLKDEDEIVGNNNSEVVISDSTTNMATKTAEYKDKSVHKLEGNVRKYIQRKNIGKYETKTENGFPKKNFTNHEHSDNDEYRDNKGSYGPNDKSDLISNESLCGNDHSLEVQSTNNTTVTQSSEELVDNETKEKIIQNKADTHISCKDDSQSQFEAKVIEFSVNSHENNEEDVSSDVINKSIPETSFDSSEKQSTFIKSSLSQKGKSRFRNLRSSCPIKHKKLYIINTKKTKGTLMTHKYTNLKCDSQERNTGTVYHTEFNLTADEESSLVAIANAETNLQPNSIEGSSQCEMIIKSQSTCNEDKEISNKNPVKVLEALVNRNDCQNNPSNVTGSYKFEVPITKTNGDSTDKEVSNKIPPDDFKNNVQVTCGSTNKDSTTFHLEDEESGKKELDLKSVLHNSSSKTYSIVANTLANFESNSSENDAFCKAKDVISQTKIKIIDSEEMLKDKKSLKRIVKKSGKSSTCEDYKGTVSGKPVLSEREENSQSVSNILENSLEKQNDKLIDDGSSTAIGVGTKSSLESNDQITENSHSEPDQLIEEVSKSTSSKSNDDQITEDSQNEPNELFEEVSCDKCSLKFYNQDDLFDHIGSHYDL